MTRKPPRVYVDSSVFGGVFDKEFSRPSSVFLDQVKGGKFSLVLSVVVEEELAAAPAKVQSFYRSLLPLAEIVPTTEAALLLRDAYLKAGIVAAQWAADALHVAHASVSGSQMIVSWNFRHIVHYEKIVLYNAVNVREGYSPIGIYTPREVIEYEEEEF